MTDYIDIFGSEEFHSEFSNSNSKLSDYEDYLVNNAGSEVADLSDESLQIDNWDDTYTVEVSGHSMSDRRDSAETWLQDNTDFYDSSSCSIVFDYWNNLCCAPVGAACVEGWETEDEKVALVDVESTNIEEFTSGHELGHTAGAKHKMVYYQDNDGYTFDCQDPDPDATYLWTSEDVNDSCNCSDDRDPSHLLDRYSGGADDCSPNSRSAIYNTIN